VQGLAISTFQVVLLPTVLGGAYKLNGRLI